MGSRTVYGVMPDWNPAEIIGIPETPSIITIQELVTDSIWAYQRHNYGYRNLRSFPLMTSFYGLPYIDVRVSFNSFIPATLDENLAHKLVDHYIQQLVDEPTLHDKVEFDIVHSCYTFDLPDKLNRLNNGKFTEEEINHLEQSLKELTNKILHPEKGLWRIDAGNKNTMIEDKKYLTVVG